MAQRTTALLALVGHLLVWSTPCPATPSAHPHPEDASSESAHAVHGAHTPEATASDAAPRLSLVRTCPCGCDQRPQAAGVSIAPGLALLPAAPGLALHATAGFDPVESTPTALDTHRAPPDHVPLVSLS